MSKETETTETGLNHNCPFCGEAIQNLMTTDRNFSGQVAGGICICFYCKNLIKIGTDFSLSKMSDDDFAVLPFETKRSLSIMRTLQVKSSSKEV